jgi:predicted ATPase
LPQLFIVLRGLEVHYLVRGQVPIARALGEQLWELAQRQEDAALLVGASHALGQSLFFLGELAEARGYLEQGIALYDPSQHCFAAWPGGHPGPQCFIYGAWTLWLLGYPDQAMRQSQAALTLIEELSHPFSHASVLVFTALLHQFRRETEVARTRAAAAMALCREQRIALYLEIGRMVEGWAVAAQGQGAEGMRQMRQGLEAYRGARAEGFVPYFLGLLAETAGRMGQADNGLTLLAEALAVMDHTGQRFYEAELHRLKGGLLLQQSSDKHTEAAAYFQRALEVARRQEAKALELRAAMSLSRLWQQQGKRKEARDLLAPIYGWFTEGFDTADLQEAKALVEALA